MAHTCPRCGQYCNCRGDWDDCDFGIDLNCQCDCDESDEDWEDVDDEWDEEVEKSFKETININNNGTKTGQQE